MTKSRLNLLHEVRYRIVQNISYSIQNAKKELFCCLKQAAADADAAHQRQLLLAAAASRSSSVYHTTHVVLLSNERGPEVQLSNIQQRVSWVGVPSLTSGHFRLVRSKDNR